MKRYGQVVRLKPEKRDEYVRHHGAVWPGVLKTIAECNIRNYSIFEHGELLFGYFEYHGNDFAADMAKMAACPETASAGGLSCFPCWRNCRRKSRASDGLTWPRFSTSMECPRPGDQATVDLEGT